MAQNGIAETASERTDLIKLASIIALVGNAALAVAKITVGLLFSSLAVVGDGIDSSTDVVIAVMSLVISMVIAQPADAEHPWGHTRAETIGTTILSFILFFAGGQLILTAIGDILAGEQVALPGLPAFIVSVCSIVGKTLLALSQYAIGKKAGSKMLKANGVNMRNDVIISTSVLIGIGLAVLLKAPLADSITAILVGLWVLRSAVGIFLEVNVELMDGSQDRGPYATIFEAVRSVPGALRPHRARMRRIANLWDIDLDIEVDGRLSVEEAHGICAAVERAIKRSLPDVYDIMVHVEPAGHGEHAGDEAYGLSESDMAKETP